jgi:hypothetical protein
VEGTAVVTLMSVVQGKRRFEVVMLSFLVVLEMSGIGSV